MPGEIATAYVRLRPIADTFRAEAAAQVGASLSGLNKTVTAAPTNQLRGQVAMAKASNAELSAIASTRARENVTEAAAQIRSLGAIGEAYGRLAHNAELSATEQKAASNLAQEADAKRMVLLGRNVDEAKEKVGGFGDTLKGLAATFGTTIGAIAAVNLVKEVVASAAAGQKSAEAITDNFGKSGEAIKKFATGAASDLGLSATAVETTAARFGIAYRQIGIAEPLAAKMTLGFTKLAGSIATIRGIDPAQVMGSLSSAAAGNTRALRTLGITIDQSQLKYAAFKLGIISTITTALTPAQRAEAVYALATAKLGTYQKEAAGHTKDLETVQRRLSAEWSNAKDILGAALLPILAKYGKKLADWLEQMEKSGKLQRDVNTAMKDAKAIVGVLADAFHHLAPPIEAVVTALGGLKKALLILGGTYGAYRLGNITAGLLGIGKKADGANTAVGGLKKSLLGLRALGVIGVTIAVAYEIGKYGTQFANFLGKQKGLNNFANKYLGTGIGNTSSADMLHDVAILAKQRNTDELRKIAGINAFPKQVRDAANAAIAKLTGPQTFGGEGSQPSAAQQAKGGLVSILSVVQGITGKIQDVKTKLAVDLAGWKQEIALKKQFDVGQAVADKIFNSQVKAAIGAAAQGLRDAIRAGQQAVAASIAEGNAQIAAAHKTLGDFLVSSYESKEAAIKAGDARLQSAGQSAVAHLKTFGDALQSAVNKALDIKLGGKSALTGGGPFGPAIAKLQALVGSGKQPSFQLLQTARAALAQTNPSTTGQLTVSQRVSQAKRVVDAHLQLLFLQAAKGDLTVKQLSTKMTGYLNKVGLSYKTLTHTLGTAGAKAFEANLHNYGAQLKQINLLPAALRKKVLGLGQNGLASPIVNILAVMQANTNAAKLRADKDGRTLRQDLQKLRDVTKEAAARTHKVTVNADNRIKRAQTHLGDVNATESLNVARHHLQEAKQQTTLMKKIHTVAANIAKTNAILAGVHVNNSGFPHSTAQNPGTSSKSARRAAAAGSH